jgi:hypothetical protein
MNHLPIRLSAVSSHQRYALVSALTATLNELGWVLDHQQFSNLALTVTFEIALENVPRIRAGLNALPLELSDESLEAMAALEGASATALPDPVPGSIHLAFVHSDPDLRVRVPAVPG